MTHAHARVEHVDAHPAAAPGAVTVGAVTTGAIIDAVEAPRRASLYAVRTDVQTSDVGLGEWIFCLQVAAQRNEAAFERTRL